MNRLTTGDDHSSESTRTIHVPVRDAYAPSSVDEKIARESARKKYENDTRPAWKQALSSSWGRVAFAAVVLIGLSPQLVRYMSGRAESADLAAIRKLGVPISQAELIPPAVPLQDNAAPLYQDSFLRLVGPGPERQAYSQLQKCDVFGVVGRTVKPATKSAPAQEIRTYGELPHPASAEIGLQQIKKLSLVIEQVRTAATRPHSYFATGEKIKLPTKIYDWTRYSERDTFFPYDDKAWATQLMCLTAIVEMESGQEAQGAKDLRAAAQIINQSAGEYIWTATGSSWSALVVFERRCWVLAKQHPNDRRMLQDIADAYDLLEEKWKIPWTAGADMPRILAEYQSAVDDPKGYQEVKRQYKHDPPMTLSENRFLMGVARRQAVHLWRGVFEVLATNPDPHTAAKAFSDAQQAAISKWPLSSFLDYDFGGGAAMCNFLGDESTMHRLYGQAIHLLLYRAEHGAFPPTVIGGSRVSGLDPFSGKDLIYKPTAKGLTLYSVGEDIVDNGGDGTNSYGKDLINEGPDIVLTYP